MAHDSNLIISSPVSVEMDVQPVLGVIGTNHELCISGNINPLAKKKPVNIPGKVSVTDAERKSVNYGIVIPELTISSSRPEPGEPWSHAKPTSDYRVLDFDGYSHNSVPPVAIGWNSGVAGDAQPVDWANSDTAAIVLFVGRSSRHHVTGGIELSDLKFDTRELSELYFWVALMTGNNLYLKRSDRTLAQIVSSEYEAVLFYIRAASGHSADFNGELAGIADDYTFQVFIGTTSRDGMTSRDIYSITRIFSLNCAGGMDVRDFGNVIAPWDKLLTVNMTTDARISLIGTGSFRRYEFVSDSISEFVRGVLSESSVQSFVYFVELQYIGPSGGFPEGSGYVDHKTIVGGTAISVGSGASVTKTINLNGIEFFATIDQTVVLAVNIMGARTAASTKKNLKTRSYLIQANGQIYIG